MPVTGRRQHATQRGIAGGGVEYQQRSLPGSDEAVKRITP
jgi:hypothetical protein